MTDTIPILVVLDPPRTWLETWFQQVQSDSGTEMVWTFQGPRACLQAADVHAAARGIQRHLRALQQWRGHDDRTGKEYRASWYWTHEALERLQEQTDDSRR